ncbi:MAG: transketolase C-terminal domain-containing protein, partial [Angustibacter sp.]
ETGVPTGTAGAPGWTDIFEAEMVAIAAENPRVVALTASMCAPVGLDSFAEKFPDRIIDVGIAEQHATTSAAGLAFAGLHPVFAVYATFLNRAFDQLLLDVALHREAVTFVLDRAGITGNDGPSHHGMWDLTLLQLVPGIRVAAPRDAATLRAQLREAIAIDDGPSVVRYSKGSVPRQDLPALARRGPVDILHCDEQPEVLLIGIGSLAPLAMECAGRLAAHGVRVTVADPRWVLPVAAELVELMAEHRLVVVLEDNLRVGGIGARIAQASRDARLAAPVIDLGLPAEFIDHADRAEILAACGLTGQDVTRRVVEEFARLDSAEPRSTPTESRSTPTTTRSTPAKSQATGRSQR